MKMIKLIFFALVCMVPGIVVLENYEIGGLNALPLFLGGMFYGVYTLHKYKEDHD